MVSSDTDNLQTDLNRLGEWAVGNGMKINLGKIKRQALQKERIRYYFEFN
jgi:hypothetical protein